MQNVLSLIKGFIGEMGGQLAPEAVAEEQRYHLAPAEPRAITGDFFEIPAKPGRRMAFQLFQIGLSRTYLVGQIQMEHEVRPVHYASVASVVLHREDGRFSPYIRPLKTDLLLLDLEDLDEQDVVERYREGIEIVDCRSTDPGYKGKRIAAMRESARVQREMQEEGLLACEEQREEGVLIVVNGSLEHIDGAENTPGIIGIVPAEADILGDASGVLAIPFGARSALDTSESPAAFYMRLREARGANPDFGLVRIELGRKPDGKPADEEWASDIASLMLAERFPVNPHVEGWDKMIFALQSAGEYINTLIPPPKMVTTYFGRSTA
jgi:hypothetical protein